MGKKKAAALTPDRDNPAPPDEDAGRAGATISAAEETSPADFEATLQKVEKIVRALESGELTLDESLQQYETAVGQMRRCYRMLAAAEQRIAVLSGFDADGEAVTEPMASWSNESLAEKQAARAGRRGAGRREAGGSEAGQRSPEDELF